MSIEIPPPPDPKALMAEFDLGAKKSFGQNFLRDQNMLRVIADAAKRRAPNGVVVEIGAGLGALTYHLLAVGLRVVAIERDRDLVPILEREFAWAGRPTDHQRDGCCEARLSGFSRRTWWPDHHGG